MSELFLEDINVGDEVRPDGKGPMTPAHIMRWSSAIENWHRIHYDRPFATGHDGLPELLINGSWKQHFLIQLLTDWAGDTGWVWKVKFQYRRMNISGETLTAWARVEKKEHKGAFGLVYLAVGIRNQESEEGTPGNAVLIFPKRNGPRIPYPFDPTMLGS
jgi:acyl dehydratase